MYKISIVLLGIWLLCTNPVQAQCAMCKAMVENNTHDAQTQADFIGGLNKGILLLLVAPYLSIGIVGWLWYRQRQRIKRLVD